MNSTQYLINSDLRAAAQRQHTADLTAACRMLRDVLAHLEHRGGTRPADSDSDRPCAAHETDTCPECHQTSPVAYSKSICHDPNCPLKLALDAAERVLAPAAPATPSSRKGNAT